MRQGSGRLRAPLLALLVLTPALAGCVLPLPGRDAGLVVEEDPERVERSQGQAGEFVTPFTWEPGFTWTWVADDGAVLVDIVAEIAETARSRLYRVESYEMIEPHLAPVHKTHVYDARTLGLVRTTDARGVLEYKPMNAPLLIFEGARIVELGSRLASGATVNASRAVTIHSLGNETVKVPAGTFDARKIQAYMNETRGDGRIFRNDITRWFSHEARNDVAFERDGRRFLLQSFRLEANATVEPPRPRDVAIDFASWDVGYVWTYIEKNGTRLTQAVIGEEMRDGRRVFKVRETYEVTGYTTSRMVQVGYYDAATLARLNFTQTNPSLDVRYSPTAPPQLLVRSGTYRYTETTTAIRTTWNHDHILRITNAGRENVTVPAGTFLAHRIETEGSLESRESDQGGTYSTVRWWSPEVANDVKFTRLNGAEYYLLSFQPGVLRKWDRDW